MSTRLLHWNVFEDGLADTPGNMAFSTSFTQQFSALLSVLSDSSGSGHADFFGFAPARDFGQLPDAVPINSTTAFFGHIDLLYTLVYHCLGGEAELSEHELPVAYAAREAALASGAAGTSISVGGTLRSLFLQSSLALPAAAPSSANPWRADAFDEQLAVVQKACAAPEQAAHTLRALKDATFDPVAGTLTWSAAVGRRVWKRETLSLCKWMGIGADGTAATRGLSIFISPPRSGVTQPAAAALARLCRVGTLAPFIRALVEVELDEHGALRKLRTPTFQAAVRWLLAELLEHAKHNPHAKKAVLAFAAAVRVDDAAPAPAARLPAADAIFALLLPQMRKWTESVALRHRHALVCRRLADARPSVVTAVEFDGMWRAMPWAGARAPVHYELVTHGRGTAAVLYDPHVYEHVELAGVALPTRVRSSRERGDGVNGTHGALADAAPKNSCVAALRRTADGVTLVVVAVHLESGPPSDSKKVELRAAQVRALLVEVEGIARALAAASVHALLVVGGDFNALREEFVHGNGAAFYAAPSVAAVRPTLKPPANGAAVAAAPSPPLARLGDGGELQLRCDACDGAWLVEASSAPYADGAATRAPAASCTRAGSSVTIDFLLLGSVGGTLSSAAPYRVVPAADVAASADAADGIRHAVTNWGSDHLPVAVDAVLAPTLADGAAACDVSDGGVDACTLL